MFPMRVGNWQFGYEERDFQGGTHPRPSLCSGRRYSYLAALRPYPVQSHGKSRHRALAGTAARSHVNNLGWSAATPEDAPRRKTAAAAQPHCHWLAFHTPHIHTATGLPLHTIRPKLCGCSAAVAQWRCTSAGVAALHLRLFKWGCSAALFCA